MDFRTLKGLRLAVAGGGVTGLVIAAEALRQGAQVAVFDPRVPGDNASGVAAGMLSPALEAVTERGAGGDYETFAESFALWPAFVEALGLGPAPDLRAGALYLGGEPVLDDVSERLAELGVGAARRAPTDSRAGLGALEIDEDGRVEPRRMLERLRAFVRDRGGALVAASCPGPPAPDFDVTVIAAGYEARRWSAVAPELAVLQPIKGHVLHFDGGPASGPTLRGGEGYAAPQGHGVIFGATMEAGRADLTVDPAIVDRLGRAAVALSPELSRVAFTARVGVRAAAPDGRPILGRSMGGLHLAVGLRRNGWLLAPLVARTVVEQLQGGSGRPEWRVDRFAPSTVTPPRP